MECAENFNAIVMPSRTIMLTCVPPELNNSETLHAYFSKFGALLWVNEKYERDPETAIITFFSIAEAIGAFMSNEAILEVDSIQRSWFEYTEKCEYCPYKYSSQESIKKHIAQCHAAKGFEDELPVDDENAKGPVNVAETHQPPNVKNFELMQNCTTRDLLRNKNERIENEMTSLKRKNSDLSDALNKSVKQREVEQSENGILNDQFALLRAQKSSADENFKENRKRLEEKDLKLTEMSTKFETLQKEKKRMTHEFLTLKQKYEDLNNSFNRALEQRNLARSEAETLRIDLETLKADKNGVDGLLKDKFKQLEGKELEFMRFLSGHELLLKEKERLENELNAMRDIGTENQRMEVEISSLKLKIKELNEASRQGNMKQDTSSIAMNCNLQVLLAENQKLVHDFKVDCKRLEEMEQDFKRVSVKYHLLLRQKEQLGQRLPDKEVRTDRNAAIETTFPALKSQNEDANSALCEMKKDRDLVHSKVHTLNEQLKSVLTEKGKIEASFNDKCKLIEEKELEIIHITTKYEWLLKETELMDKDLISLRRKNEDLILSFNNAIEQRDFELSQVLTLNDKLKALQNDKQEISDILKEKCQQLDIKQTELGQLSMKLELQSKENQILDTDPKGTKELLVGKKFVSTDCSSLKRKNNILTNTLHTVEKEKGTPQSRIPLLNGGLHGLQMEKEKVAEPLKDDLMHLEGKELDLKRYSTRDEWLISGMECANSELKDWLKERERMSNEMMALTLKNKELTGTLNLTIMQRENERFDIGNLHGKLQTLQKEMDNVLKDLEGNRRQLEERELEVKRLSEMNNLLESELNGLKAQKEQLGGFAAEENVRLKMEIEAFRRDKYKLNSEMEVNNLQLQDKEIKMSSILMNNEMLQKDIDRLESEIKEKSRELLNRESMLMNLTKENQKLNEELQIKDKLLQNIQSSINILTPKKCQAPDT